MYEIYNLKPVAFHSYTSIVQDRILSLDFSDNNELKLLRKELISLFRKHEIKTIWGTEVNDDNKIVFEVEYNGVTLFYGFYDWTFSIGLWCLDYNKKEK